MKPICKETAKEFLRLFGTAFIAVAICNLINGWNWMYQLRAIPVLLIVDLLFSLFYYFAHK